MLQVKLSNRIQEAMEEGLILLQDLIADSKKITILSQMGEKLADVYRNGGKVIACGNGGSSTDASHFAEELTGQFRKPRPALPAIALTDAAHITCVANDMGFDEIFSRGVAAFGKSGDILLALSTSGNSPNIIRAVEEAKSKGLSVFLFLGRDGGKLKGKGDFEFLVPGSTSDRIQELHMMALHIVIECVERILNPENYLE